MTSVVDQRIIGL